MTEEVGEQEQAKVGGGWQGSRCNNSPCFQSRAGKQLVGRQHYWDCLSLWFRDGEESISLQPALTLKWSLAQAQEVSTHHNTVVGSCASDIDFTAFPITVKQTGRPSVVKHLSANSCRHDYSSQQALPFHCES